MLAYISAETRAPQKTVLLPKPRGFCAGVIRAIDIVEIALKQLGAPVYVRKEIVHNRFVVDDLRAQGAVFVESLEEVPDGAVTIFSAHGVAPEVRNEARARRLRVIDATCPLVTKVHLEVIRYAREGYSVVLIGHENHDEVIGTFGEAPESIHVVSSLSDVDELKIADPARVVYTTQTTLSLDDTRAIIERLKERFPFILSPPTSDICYATQNRQDAVKQLAQRVELILVIGSRNSENSNQLVKVGRALGKPSYLIDDHKQIDPAWLKGISRVGITSGASVPDRLVQAALDFFKQQGAQVEELGLVEENIHFALPDETVLGPESSV